MQHDRPIGEPHVKRDALKTAVAESEDGWVDILTWEAAFTEHLEAGYDGAVRQAYSNMGISYE